MRRAGLSAKTATILHANRAGSAVVNSWRYRTKRRISRLKKAGFAVAVIDETSFIYRDAAGRKYWSLVGTPVRVEHAVGRRRPIYLAQSQTTGGSFSGRLSANSTTRR